MRRGLLLLLVLCAALAAVAAPAHAQAPPEVAARAYLVVDAKTGEVLAERNADARRQIASITKLMTAIVVLERAKLSDVVTVSPQAARIGESTVYLRAGERLTVAELLRATLIPSANDAAEALALHVGGGSVDRFVELMNEKAADLGLSDTHFENPHGLDEAGHVSSARDVTKLVRFALGIPFVRDTLSRETLTLPGDRRFETTDDLLRSWAPLVAGKTGHTGAAGWAPAAAAPRGATTVYGAVLGSGSRSARNEALQQLLTFGLDQYRTVRVLDARRVYATASTGYGKADVELVVPRGSVTSVRTGRPLVERVIAPGSLALPVAKGQRIGRVEVYEGNRLVAASTLLAADAVADASLWDKVQWHARETVANLWGMVT